MKITKLVGALLALSSSLVVADDISLGYPGHNGSGCPIGSVSATLSPDYKQLSLLFNEYSVEARGTTKTDRKTCNLAVPVHVPQGLSFSILGLEYRGYNGLPRGASSTLSASYFFPGSPGVQTARTFYGALDDEYLVKHDLLAGAIVWSPCGADVNLRINSSMKVTTNAKGEQAQATVDSIDLSAGMIYHLQWRKCQR